MYRDIRKKFERGNCKLNLTREISSSAGWQMKSLVRISELKNGEEKKRNPRKERSGRKCLIHSIFMARTRKALH